MTQKKWSRRHVLACATATLAMPSLALAQAESAPTRRNISSFKLHDWRDHFDTLGKGIILSDTNTKVLQHWTADGEMRIYPTSVPLTDELTRRGYTSVVEKRENPTWRPTPSMLKRNPEWPAVVEGGDDAWRAALGRRARSR